MSTNSQPSQARAPRFSVPTLAQIFWGPLASRIRRMAQWRKQGLLGEALQAQRRRLMRFETLEPRLLLSADLTHTVASGAALDATLKIADLDGAAVVQLVDNTSSAVLEALALDQDVNVTVLGNDMGDRLAIGFDRAALAHQLKVLFDGGDGGGNELIGPDQAHTWQLSAPDAGTVDDVSFVSFSRVQHVKGGAGDQTFVVLDPSTTTAVEGGGGNNTLVAADSDNAWNVSGTDSGTLNGQSFTGIQNLTGGAGKDTVTVAPGGKVDGTVSGGAGDNTLVAADQDNAWTVSGANSGTLNGTVFADIENLAGGAGNDTFTFTAGGQLSGTLSGGGGNDTLVAADTDNTWVISGANAGTLNGTSFSGIENLRGGAGADTFVFAGGNISGSIDGGAGTNTFDYSAFASAVTVDLGVGSATGAGAIANVNDVIGGSGSDTLKGPAADSSWAITGQDSGSVAGVAFSSFENLSGGAGADNFAFDIAGGLYGGIDGGSGSDTVVGASKANLWNVNGTDAGTLDGIAYASVENLLGGSDNDTFALMAAGVVSGGIDGGVGADTVRGPQRKTAWRFNGQGSGSAGGTKFSRVEAVEGGSDEDTLVGPGEDSTWTVDGPNSGNVGGLSFSGIENLEGAANNQDTFVVEAAGSVSGVIDGGAGGFDTLVVNGSYNTIVFTPTSGDSGIVARDGELLAYAGLEPVNAGTAANVVFNGTANADSWVLEDSATPGQIQVRSTNGSIETTSFANPVSLTINLGAGNDTLTLASLGDSGFSGTILVDAQGDSDTVDLSGTMALVKFPDGSAIATHGGVVARLVNAETFTGATTTITEQGLPSWLSEGPSSITGGQTQLPAQTNPVIGAVNQVAADPFDPNVLFAATVGGGVWRNNDRTIFFSSGFSNLDNDSKSVLNAYATFLKKNPGLVVQVTGYEDGADVVDGGQSQPRADAVANYLISQGVQAAQLSVHDGHSTPIAPSDTPAHEALNRRVELIANHWTPLTDAYPSLAIGGISLSPLDALGNAVTATTPLDQLVLYAGTGQFSSNNQGGAAVGILKSTDGGDTWSLLASADLNRLNIASVVATSLKDSGNQIVLVAARSLRDPVGNVVLPGGLFRSIDGGEHFAPIANTQGDATALVADPGKPGRFYAAVGGQGVLVSDSNDGATWNATGTQPTNAAGAAAAAQRVVLAVQPDPANPSDVLFATLVNGGAPTGVFRSTDQGGTWTPFGQGAQHNAPLSNPGLQANLQLSMQADLTGTQLFIGGDVDTVSNDNIFTGNIVLGDFVNNPNSAWTLVTKANAGGTAPHADSRSMTLDAAGRLIETDDGGIYRLTLPVDSAHRTWSSVNADLAVTEIVSLAYDPLSNVFFSGHQDTGSATQIGKPSDPVDSNADGIPDDFATRSVWQQIAGGPFNAVAIAPGGAATAASFQGDGNGQLAVQVDGAHVLRFTMSNNFNGFVSRLYDANGDNKTTASTVIGGMPVNAAGNPLATAPTTANPGGVFTTDDVVGLRSGNGARVYSGLQAADRAVLNSSPAVYATIPYVVNAVDSTKMLIGHYSLYESSNRLETIKPIYSSPLGANAQVQFAPAPGTAYTALAYGGMKNNAPAADVIYAARGPKLFVRVHGAAATAFTNVSIPGSGSIQSIVMDPEDWEKAYATDGVSIYGTSDHGQHWITVSQSLQMPSVPVGAIRTLEIVKDGNSKVLLAGTVLGVYRAIDPSQNVDWVRVGVNLPNAAVTTVRFVDRANTTSDVLYAGTQGRGAWAVYGDVAATLGMTSTLTIEGTSSDDVFTLERNANNPLLVDIFETSTLAPVLTVPLSSIQNIVVNGGGGNDTLVLDSSNGPLSVPGGISFDGDSGDTLTLQGSTRTAFFELPIASIVTRTITDQATNQTETVTVGVNATFNNLPEADPTAKAGGGFEDFLKWIDQLGTLPTSGGGTTQPSLGLFGSSLFGAIQGLPLGGAAGESDSSVPAGNPVPGEELGNDNGLVGFLRLLESGTGAFDIGEIGTSITSFSDLAAKLDALDGVSNNTYVDSNDAQKIHFGLVKDLEGQAKLDAAFSYLGGDVDLAGDFDLSATVTVNLVFGVDGTGFYIDTSDSASDLAINNVKINGEGHADGRFGFLDVGANIADTNGLVIDPSVGLAVNLSSAAVDKKLRLTDLAKDLGSDVNVSATGNTGHDIALKLDVVASALIPGIDSFNLGDAELTIDWGNVSSPGSASVSASGGFASDILDFLKVDVQQVRDEIAKVTNLSGALKVDIPYLSASLSDVLDLTSFINSKVIDPLSAGGSADFASAQNLAMSLIQSLGIDPAQFGFSFDAGKELLTYHLHLDQTVTNKTIGLGNGLNLDTGLADLSFSTNATVDASLALDVTFGLDIAAIVAGKPVDEWFFLQNPTATGTVSLSASNINASARFGFLSIDVFDGSLRGASPSDPASISVNVNLKDPNSDGRIDMQELLEGLGHLDQLVAADITGFAELDLPIKAPFLGIVGNTATADNTLVVQTDFKTANVQIPDAIKDVGNFAHMDAASFVGLMGQVTGWLDQFRHSDTFANFDVPLIGPALDKVLALNTAFRDAILYDQGADGVIDGTNKLATDVNAALKTAGLDAKLRAEISNGKIELIANDFSGTAFTVTSASNNELGFGTSQSSAGDPVSVTATNAAPAKGELSADSTFTVTFNGGSPVNVTVHQSDTADNTDLGDDHRKLVDASNAATFSTVDEMALRVAQILGISNALAYNKNDQTLAFTLALTPIFGSIDLPVNFDLDLKPLLQLTSNSLLHLSADGQLHLTVGAYLGDAPSSSKLDTTKPLSGINGGVQNKTDLVITGTQDVRTVYGRLTGDANFGISINGGAVTNVKVTKASTDDNVTAADLVTDINGALSGAGLASKIQASALGNRIILTAIDGGITSVHLTSSNADPAVTDIGLAAAQDGVYEIIASQDLVATNGQLSTDASFGISINGGGATTVTINKAATSGNSNISGLIANMNSALAAAALDSKIKAVAIGNRVVLMAVGTGITSVHFSATQGNAAITDIGFAASQDASLRIGATKDLVTLYGRLTGDAAFDVTLNNNAPVTVTVLKTDTDTNRYSFDIVNDVQAAIDATSLKGAVTAGFANNRLTLTAAGATAFSLTASGPAVNELGLGASNAGNSNEFTISTRDGSTYGINLDGLTDLDSLFTAIHTQTNNKVTAILNARATGINLTDSSNGNGTFKVQSANNSSAATTLGILRADAQQGEAPDGLIEGADIAGLTPGDRFFLQNVNASVGLHLTTPSGLDLAAHLGFLGIELSGNASVNATLGMALKDPGTTAADGRISLTELFNGLSDISTLLDAPSLTGGGDISLSVSVNPSIPGLTITADPLVLHINSFGDPFTGALPDVSLTVPDDLVAFNNPDFSFTNILEGLKSLADFLAQFQSFGFLSEPIPLVNVSIKDLVNLADKFSTALDQANADPAGTVQVLQDKLKEAFGIPKLSNLLTMALFIDPHGAGTDDDQYFLRFTIDLSTDFNKSLSVNMDLGSGLSIGGSAGLNAAGNLDAKLDFGIDLHNPTEVDIFGGTGITANLTASGDALNFKAALGPAGIFIKNGSAGLTVGVTGGVNDLSGDQHIALAQVAQNGLHIDPTGSIHSATDSSKPAILPVYFPIESKHAGDITFDWKDITVTDPNNSKGPHLVVPDNLLSIDPSQFSLLDQLSLGVDGIDLFLGGLQDLMDGEIGGVKLPLIGDKLSGAAHGIGDFRTEFIDQLRQAIDDFANPEADFAQGGTDPISKILYHLLGPKNQGGLGLLQDSNGNGVGPDDIVYAGNINDPGVSLQDFFLNWHFKVGDTIVDADPGIGFDVGIPGLGLETRGNVHLNIGWSLNFGFGLDYTDGFYVDVSPHDELKLDVDVSIPGGGITGTLGFLQLTADDHKVNGVGQTHLGATFGIDIFNSEDKNDGKLSFAELGNLGISAGIAADAVVDLDARLSLSNSLVPNAATNFPSVVAEFVLDWGVGDRGAGQLVALGDLHGSFLSDGLQFVGFKNVGLDLGSYFSNFIEPLAKKIQEYTAPIKPFLDFLTAPLPVISDLAGPTSLLDIAASTGAVNPEFVQAVEFVDKIVDIANELVIPNNGELILKFGTGEFPIFDNRGGSGSLMLDLTNPASIGDALTSGKLKLPSWADLGGLQDALDAVAPVLQDAISSMAAAAGAAPKTKLSLPIIDDPSQVFGMLLGKHAVLLDLNLAPLDVKASFSAFFPLLGPLGVSINADFDMHIHFDFGYDTLGIEEFAKGGFKNPEVLFDGFFVNDLDSSGKPENQLTFDAGLWAAAELNLAIARGGVGGGVFAHIAFHLHDPNKDGRVRIDELVTDILNEYRYGDPVLSPLAIFDISGDLEARLFAFVKVDLFLFSLDESWDITPPLTLLKFDNVFKRYPTLATELGDGVLQLNMGPNAGQRIEGDLTDGSEEFHIKQGSDASHVLVWAPGLGVTEQDAQSYEVTKAIVATGGAGDDTVDASGVTADIDFNLEGDAGKDTLTAGSGKGHAKILGGAGDDTLTGGGGADTIFGEAGADTIFGGGGNDVIFGDGDPKNSIQGNLLVAEIKASDGKDTIDGEGGDDIILGSGGADTIHGGADNDTILADAGKVTLDNNGAVVAVELTDKGKGGNDFIYGDDGLDLLYGGPGNDTIDGGDKADTIFGESGFDILTGGEGADVIHGGADDDAIHGNLGNDTIYGDAGNDTLDGDENDDWLYGGEGADIMHGGDGADHLLGNGGGDSLFGDAGNDYLEGGGGDDLTLGGDGNDILVGGFGSDTLDGQNQGDIYRISSRGGDTDQLTTAYDTGDSGMNPGTDTLTVIGTAGNDTFLLRAMADYYYQNYYPDEAGKGTVTDALAKVFDDTTINDPLGFGANALPLTTAATMLSELVPTNGQLTEDVNFSVSDGTHEGRGLLHASDTAKYTTAAQLVSGLQGAVNDALSKMHTAGSSSTVTITVGQSNGKISLTASAAGLSIRGNHSLEALEKAVTDAYTFNQMFDVPDGMLEALEAAYANDPNDLNGLKSAVSGKAIDAGLAYLYSLAKTPFDNKSLSNSQKVAQIEQAITEAYSPGPVPAGMLDALNAVTDFTDFSKIEAAIQSKYDKTDPNAHHETGFVALLNNGGAHVERFNYRKIEGLTVNTVQGNDYVVLDDVIGATTINLGLGNDRAQIGQVFNSERVGDFDTLITGIQPLDAFGTLPITRGWLSNGISVASTINGGEGNDEFTVFHNVAVLNLNGGDGDDIFTVRAFALAGSIDSQRARTDIKGDGGADTILYVANAPVNIDGGDGFDTVRIVGTEFADDFVVTDAGVFGAGLNVNYVNIEKLVADGAEGNDRFFVLSTGIDVVTELDGGLGSDSFFVGGTPQSGPIPVISNDFRGYSSIILNSVESTDPSYNGIAADGVSANVVDDEESNIIVTESDGFSRVTEGATSGGEGWQYDSYAVRLSRSPKAGLTAVIDAVPSELGPEDQARGFQGLEFLQPKNNPGDPDVWAATPPVLTFTDSNGNKPWNVAQVVKFRAANDGKQEGTRYAFINHTTSDSTDPGYKLAKLLSVKVQVNDADQAGVLVTPTGRDNTVLEGGFQDTVQVVLTRQPTDTVTVNLGTTNNQVNLSQTTLTFSATGADANAWNKPQTVTITAKDDQVVEGFHTDYITYTVSSNDKSVDVPVTKYLVNGDFDLGDANTNPREIPIDKPTSFLFLRDKPDLSQNVTVLYNPDDNTDGDGNVEKDGDPLPVFDPQDENQQTDNVLRYLITGNTLEFYKNGLPVEISGAVQVSYSYLKVGYDKLAVHDSVVDIYDNDAPGVIVRQTNGSTDLIEGTPQLDPYYSDTYTVVLSKAPAQGTTVNIDVASIDTRSTIASTGEANFMKHVYVDGQLTKTLTFDSNDWSTPKTVTVTAINDNIVDGDDTQVFAPQPQTTHKIRGPLDLEGAAGAGSLSLPAPLMLPGERNVRPFDGKVVDFTPGSGAGATEFMTVNKTDLEAKLPDFKNDDPPINTIFDLVGKTIELTEGPGTGVVLDPTRPGDLFNRFWLIKTVQDLGNGNVKLTLQNPSAVNPGLANVTAPTAATKYAVTSLSVNFFADERQSVDYTMVFDNDSVANENGALTSSTGNVLDFSAGVGIDTMTVRTADLQAISSLPVDSSGIPDLNGLKGRSLEISVGPALGGTWTITDIINGTQAGTKKLLLTRVSGIDAPTDRSEFRIANGNTHGRIVGFGMGPNVIIGDRVQPGAISYGDMEVLQVNLGKGGDVVRVDYTTNAEDHSTKRSGDFYTLTMLNTGDGKDDVTVGLLDGQDGDFALNLGAGDDHVDASASTLPLTIFGWDGMDTITGGSGGDTIFGDIGQVDYVNGDVGRVDGVNQGTIVTRLGFSEPLDPVNPVGTSATATTITDTATMFYGGHAFPTEFGGLAGLVVQAISPKGLVQYRTIISNTADTITIDHPWDAVPVFNDANPKKNWSYRISTLPENQTDGALRGPRVVWSVMNDVGAKDTINGGGGDDIIIGGAGNDTIDAGNGNNQVAGDDARFDFVPVSGNDGPTKLLSIQDPGTIGDDTLIGGDNSDLLIGGLGNDIIRGGGNSDVLIGDDATVLYASDGVTIASIETTDRAQGGTDTIYGEGGDDVIIGGTNSDELDGGADKDLVFGDNVTLVRNAGSGDAIDPRFRALNAITIYDANGLPRVSSEFGQTIQPVPGGRPAWADLHITLDEAQTFDPSHYGNDYIAGGAGNDQIFGQLGNDTIQGDGSIDLAGVGASRDANDALMLTASVDDWAGVGKDGDDYIEGGGGNDVIFGNLGQDDIIGGSSSLFSLATPSQRPDGSDMIFGGSGTKAGRNDAGDTSANGHARDSDTIVGDNGNIYRLVGVNGTVGGVASGIAYSAGFLSFNYDDYNTGGLKIVARAVQQLDYTPGGPSFNAAGAATDIGAADEIHGEAGDDFIYTGKGSDVVFGDGQDDNIVGGYGNDWISGGTGDDGILGDDGQIFTSRNGKVEPLNGVTVAVAPSTVATGGNIQTADINVAGQLKKSFDLTPFSTDPNWNPAADEFALTNGGGVGVTQQNSDDIIFGGLGNDFLHGGSGDDAISGAEALPTSYAWTLDANGAPTGIIETDFAHPLNPGNVLAFNPTDVNGQHANRTRAGEFGLYDEYNPLTKIALPTGGEFFLNFNASEGPAAMLDATKKTDGDDKIFGDLGNDWLVGGTGRDDMYGGFGNDLLNADDDLGTAGGLNNTPDTSASYEDRAFGGAGRDVLIANTGGDRLIDWTGEYNSYLVPFSPFGLATVSRTLQPGLMDFLYALSASDGADPTRAADTGSDPARNGEPYGELGLVLQHDVAWNDQHGGPSDPQAGNSTGQRDVLRSANFNSGTASGFSPQVGTFSVANNRYQVSPSTPGGDGVSLFNESDTVIPTYFEMQATINAVKPTSGSKGNAFLIFDWQSNTDFKFAGVDISTNKIEIGHRNATGWVVDNWTVAQLKAGTDYVVMLKVNGGAVTLAQGTTSLSFTFAARTDALGINHAINDGMVGIGAMGGASAQIDDVVVQAPPRVITLDKTADFSATSPASGLFNAPTSGSWVTTSDGHYVGTTTTAPTVSLIGYPVTPGSMVDIAATLNTSGRGGIVFDYQGSNYYKFVTLSVDSNQILIGHVTDTGTVIDKTYATKLSSGTDYKLGVNLRGGLVNVSLNGGVVASNLYNETVTTFGGYGVIGVKGATSFDVVRLRTDDAAYALPALTASAAPAQPGGPTADLTDVGSALAVAEQSWLASGLVTTQALTDLGTIDLQIEDLPGLTLSLADEAHHAIVVDADAAGWGWFVDVSAASSSDFRVRLDRNVFAATPDSAAFGRMDLLTAVEHELGHLLGFDHGDAGAIAVMHEDLDPGVRYVFDAAASTSAPKPSAPSLPGFDTYAGDGGISAAVGVNWQANASDGWDIKLSPYDTGKPAKGDSNIAPFDVSLLAKQGNEKQGADFDGMGRALMGKEKDR